MVRLLVHEKGHLMVDLLEHSSAHLLAYLRDCPMVYQKGSPSVYLTVHLLENSLGVLVYLKEHPLVYQLVSQLVYHLEHRWENLLVPAYCKCERYRRCKAALQSFVSKTSDS
eukprot:m.408506 g.408506  ORF g.408506 m.408506 type:complete len:112 (+) comp21235_c0_seq2:3885-4220(+)